MDDHCGRVADEAAIDASEIDVDGGGIIVGGDHGDRIAPAVLLPELVYGHALLRSLRLAGRRYGANGGERRPSGFQKMMRSCCGCEAAPRLPLCRAVPVSGILLVLSYSISCLTHTTEEYFRAKGSFNGAKGFGAEAIAILITPIFIVFIHSTGDAISERDERPGLDSTTSHHSVPVLCPLLAPEHLSPCSALHCCILSAFIAISDKREYLLFSPSLECFARAIGTRALSSRHCGDEPLESKKATPFNVFVSAFVSYSPYQLVFRS
ncbi:hypothetical protein KSP40_PGU018813 [Platanthera guangdongensis]|uniref:Uncharacterized protein n=1 Tax=Platanthera guangdongensis TaxID=2320717 RepID=A0ABR2MPV2_9ASPA